MSFEVVYQSVLDFFGKTLDKPNGQIILLEKDEDGWIVEYEVLEDFEYTQKFAKNDILAVYTINLDSNLKVTNFQRSRLLERGSVFPE